MATNLCECVCVCCVRACDLCSLSFSVLPERFTFVSFHISAQDESVSSDAQALEPELSSDERKQKWEQGQADYMGQDSFDNIKKKLDTFLK